MDPDRPRAPEVLDTAIARERAHCDPIRPRTQAAPCRSNESCRGRDESGRVGHVRRGAVGRPGGPALGGGRRRAGRGCRSARRRRASSIERSAAFRHWAPSGVAVPKSAAKEGNLRTLVPRPRPRRRWFLQAFPCSSSGSGPRLKIVVSLVRGRLSHVETPPADPSGPAYCQSRRGTNRGTKPGRTEPHRD